MQSVCRIVEDIQSGRRSARDSLAESFDAIEALDGAIHAFTCIADRQAAFAESGPLAGVAFGVKDIFDTFDLPSEYGSPLYKGWQPRADASLVAMARAAGATVAGKTVTTEMAFFQPGPTVNPHNHAHTPGGSSSGSAAAVAAGNEGAKAMGLVVKAVRGRAGSSADGAKIAALVKSALG